MTCGCQKIHHHTEGSKACTPKCGIPSCGIGEARRSALLQACIWRASKISFRQGLGPASTEYEQQVSYPRDMWLILETCLTILPLQSSLMMQHLSEIACTDFCPTIARLLPLVLVRYCNFTKFQPPTDSTRFVRFEIQMEFHSP